jgi:hypothetical protein
MLKLKQYKKRRWFVRAALGSTLAAGLILFGTKGLGVHAAASASTQMQTPTAKGMPQSPLDDLPGAPGAPAAMDPRLQSQRDHMWSDDRHKRLIADTDKLLQLATELKVDVDKSSPNELSVKVIQKATEMEKLSHDVKERMRN